MKTFVRTLMLLGLAAAVTGCATPRTGIGGRDASGPRKQETNEDIRTAIENISDVVTQKNIRAKYCPVCGRHYSPRVEVCPFDETPLKELDE